MVPRGLDILVATQVRVNPQFRWVFSGFFSYKFRIMEFFARIRKNRNQNYGLGFMIIDIDKRGKCWIWIAITGSNSLLFNYREAGGV